MRLSLTVKVALLIDLLHTKWSPEWKSNSWPQMLCVWCFLKCFCSDTWGFKFYILSSMLEHMVRGNTAQSKQKYNEKETSVWPICSFSVSLADRAHSVAPINRKDIPFNCFLNIYFTAFCMYEYDFSYFSQYTFKDLSGSVSLAWVGDGTGVSVMLIYIYLACCVLSILLLWHE